MRCYPWMFLALFVFSQCTPKRRTFLDPPQNKTRSKQNMMKIEAAGGLRLRKSASTKSNPVAIIPSGELVEILETEKQMKTIGRKTGRWCRVDWRGKKGWLFDAFLVQLTSVHSASSRQIQNPSASLWSFLADIDKKHPQPRLMAFLKKSSNLQQYRLKTDIRQLTGQSLKTVREAVRKRGMKRAVIEAYDFDREKKLVLAHSSLNRRTGSSQSCVFLGARDNFDEVIVTPMYRGKAARISLKMIIASPDGTAACLDFEGNAQAWLTEAAGKPYLYFFYIKGFGEPLSD